VCGVVQCVRCGCWGMGGSGGGAAARRERDAGRLARQGEGVQRGGGRLAAVRAHLRLRGAHAGPRRGRDAGARARAELRPGFYNLDALGGHIHFASHWVWLPWGDSDARLLMLSVTHSRPYGVRRQLQWLKCAGFLWSCARVRESRQPATRRLCGSASSPRPPDDAVPVCRSGCAVGSRRPRTRRRPAALRLRWAARRCGPAARRRRRGRARWTLRSRSRTRSSCSRRRRGPAWPSSTRASQCRWSPATCRAPSATARRPARRPCERGAGRAPAGGASAFEALALPLASIDGTIVGFVLCPAAVCRWG